MFVSQLVITEASSGDPHAAARRQAVLAPLAILELTDEAADLAQEIVTRVALPVKAAADALHIAVAVAHGMDFLLTWNCSHIANAVFRPKVEAVCRELGFEPPTICTPEELMED